MKQGSSEVIEVEDDQKVVCQCTVGGLQKKLSKILKNKFGINDPKKLNWTVITGRGAVEEGKCEMYFKGSSQVSGASILKYDEISKHPTKYYEKNKIEKGEIAIKITEKNNNIFIKFIIEKK